MRIDLLVQLLLSASKQTPSPNFLPSVLFSFPFHSSNSACSSPANPPHFGEKFLLSGFLLSFSCWALELFLAWGTFTVNPPGILPVGWGWQHFPAHSSQLSLANITSYSCRAPQSSSRTLDPLQKVLLKTPQGTYSHLSNTIIKLSSALVCFSIGKAKWFLSGHACHSAELKWDCLGRGGWWLPALLAPNYCSKSTVFYK